MLEDDQGRFYPFNVPFALFPGGDLPILTENRGWTVEKPGNYSWTNYVPEVFALGQNYPNPFNSSTAIRFDLTVAADIELGVYNLAGQRVAILATGVHSAGAYAVHWDGRDARGSDLASGIYLYRLSADGHEQTRKLTLLH